MTTTLLEIAKAVAVEAGVEIPISVVGDDPDAIKIVQFINETGVELARRVDWHSLNVIGSITGDGTDKFYDLAPDYARLGRGLAVTVEGNPVRGSVSGDEWMALVPSMGTPRYFRLTASTIGFYPYPALAQVVRYSYQTANWASGKALMTADGDTTMLERSLMVRGAVWRWMRHVGRDFNDQMAEYEAMLADYGQAEGGVRQP